MLSSIFRHQKLCLFLPCFLLTLTLPRQAQGEHVGQQLRLFLHDIIASCQNNPTPASFAALLPKHKQLLIEATALPNEKIWQAAHMRLDMHGFLASVDLGFFTSMIAFKRSYDTFAEAIPLLPLKQGMQAATQFGFIVSASFSPFLRERFDPLQSSISHALWHAQLSEQCAKVLHAFDDFQINNTSLIDEILAQFDLSLLPDDARQQFEVGLKNFYQNLPTNRKIELVKAYLRLPPEAAIGDIIATLVIHSGVLIIKLVQLWRDYTPADVQQSLRRLLDGLEPELSHNDIMLRLQEQLPANAFNTITRIQDQALGVASVSQVHKFFYRPQAEGEEKCGVLKLIKPSVKNQVEGDLRVLEQAMADLPNGKKLVDDIAAALREELDYRQEARYTELGQVYHTAGKIHAVKLLEGFPASSELLFQELAPGKSLASMLTKTSKLSTESVALHHKRLAHLLEFLRHWYKNAVFGDGYLHADLHGGNLLVDGSTITIIDFGSSTMLPLEQRKIAIKIGLALLFNDGQSLVDSIKKLYLLANQKTALTREELAKFGKLTAAITALQSQELAMNELLTKAIQEAINLHINLTKEFIQLNRGRLFLEKHVENYALALAAIDSQGQTDYQGVLSEYIWVSFIEGLKDMLSSAAHLGQRPERLLYFVDILKSSYRKSSQVFYSTYDSGLPGLRQALIPLQRNMIDVYQSICEHLLAKP